jgi:hypothetical protein
LAIPQEEEEEHMMLDALEQDEEMEIELAFSQSQQKPPETLPRPSSVYSDDAEYDGLFDGLWEPEITPSQDSSRMDMG